MLVVKVEQWTHGDPNRTELRGIICIANKGSVLTSVVDDPDHCEYRAELQSPDGAKRQVVIDHWRRHGWVTLVAKALSALDRRR